MSRRHASWPSERAYASGVGTPRPAGRAPLLDLGAMVGLPRTTTVRLDTERSQAEARDRTADDATELAARLTQLFR